jgi:hypothetical protein
VHMVDQPFRRSTPAEISTSTYIYIHTCTQYSTLSWFLCNPNPHQRRHPTPPSGRRHLTPCLRILAAFDLHTALLHLPSRTRPLRYLHLAPTICSGRIPETFTQQQPLARQRNSTRSINLSWKASTPQQSQSRPQKTPNQAAYQI